MAYLDLDCNETGVPREAAYRSSGPIGTPLSVVDAIAELSKIIRVHVAGNPRLHLECQTGAIDAFIGFLLEAQETRRRPDSRISAEG
jgi:hypothetical protein